MAYMPLKEGVEKKKGIQRKIVPIPQCWVSKAHQYAALFGPLIPQNRQSKTTLRPITEPRLHLSGKVHQVLGVRKMQQDQ